VKQIENARKEYPEGIEDGESSENIEAPILFLFRSFQRNRSLLPCEIKVQDGTCQEETNGPRSAEEPVSFPQPLNGRSFGEESSTTPKKVSRSKSHKPLTREWEEINISFWFS
jgi:hypothetical protein